GACGSGAGRAPLVHTAAHGAVMIAIASLIIAAFAGALGGNLLTLSLTDLDLGLLRNSIAGAVGGICGGAILHALMPTLAVMSAGGIDVAVIAGQVVGGCAGGV